MVALAEVSGDGERLVDAVAMMDKLRTAGPWESEQTHESLRKFLLDAQAAGNRYVLVITGKGKIGAESERGVLRRQVPQWLALPEFRTLVVGFEEAHIGHGGEGALYVRVRRARF